jgi:hypothetical protein
MCMNTAKLLAPGENRQRSTFLSEHWTDWTYLIAGLVAWTGGRHM